MQIGQVIHQDGKGNFKGNYKGGSKGKGRGRGRGSKGRGRFNRHWRPFQSSFKGKGQGKGKGKNKGSGKGGSKGQSFQNHGSKGRGKGIVCYTCGKTGHTSRNCFQNQNQPMVQQVQHDHQQQFQYQQQQTPIPYPSPSTAFQLPPGLGTSSSISQASTTRVPHSQTPFNQNQQGHHVQTITSSSNPAFGWVMMIEQFSLGGEVSWDVNSFTLVDSGATLHVCPPQFAVQSPIQPHPNPPTIRGVNNKVLQILGTKVVQFKLSDQVVASAEFVVTECNHAILSATILAEKGFSVSFDRDGASISKDSITLPLRKFKSLYYLCPQLLDAPTSIPSNNLQVLAITAHSKGNDYWDVLQEEKLLIRHHKRSRKALFFP